MFRRGSVRMRSRPMRGLPPASAEIGPSGLLWLLVFDLGLVLGNAAAGGNELSQAVNAHCSFFSDSQPNQELVVPGCMGAEFGRSIFEDATVGAVAAAEPADGCSGESRYDGLVVLAARGGCSFEQKSRFLGAQGATAVIVANTDDDSFAMGAGTS
jgi:hypothetical protein